MHRNKIWLTFLGLVGVATLYLSATAIHAYYVYTRLAQQSPAEVRSWSVEEVAWGVFAPKALYTFEFNGSQIQGSSTLRQQLYRNEESAQESLQELNKRQWTAWFDPSNTSRSALERFFPWKEVLSATAMMVLFLYFVGLGYYVVAFR